MNNQSRPNPTLKRVTARCCSLLVLSTLFATTSVQAALVSASGNGFTLVYNQEIVNIFGEPIISGTDNQTIRFIPATGGISFRADAGVHRTGAIAFDIIPDDGFSLTGLSLTERGDFSLLDADATSGAPPAVLAGGTLRINLPSDPANEWVSRLLASDLTTAGLNNPWQATATLAGGNQDPFTGALWQGSTQPVTITLQNELYSLLNDPLDIASIDKKLLVLDLMLDATVPVPLPASAWLFGSALLFAFRGRRKASAQ